MMWVIFLMPTDQVIAFFVLFLIVGGQGYGGGVIIEIKQVCFEMLFRQFQLFYDLLEFQGSTGPLNF